MTTRETHKQKRPYRPPMMRSERILVANLFTSTDPGQGGCSVNCDFAPTEPSSVD